jgi:Holliday junction resolvase
MLYISMTEQQIQTKIILALRREGWYVNKLISTSQKGVPDLIAHKQGKTIYIEVKRPGYKPTNLQVYQMETLNKYGIETLTCNNADECIVKVQSITSAKG